MWNGYFGDIGRTIDLRQAEPPPAGGLHGGLRVARRRHRGDDARGTRTTTCADAVAAAADGHGSPTTSSASSSATGSASAPTSRPTSARSLPGAETVVLEEGMTFAVEPLIWIRGVRGGAGVRLEDTIVVDDRRRPRAHPHRVRRAAPPRLDKFAAVWDDTAVNGAPGGTPNDVGCAPGWTSAPLSLHA